MFFFRRSAACAFTVTLMTLSCGLAARAQVGVTQPAPVAPVGVKPTDEVAGVTSAPVTGAAAVTTKPVPGAAPVKTTPANGAAAVGALGGVKASGVNTGLLLLLGQIADGQMTMEQAWDKGLLNAPKVLQLLSQTQRLTEDTRNETLLRDMAGLLVRFAPESVAKPDKLSARVRVALCHYYAGNGDARAVLLCEALIAEKLDGKQINQPLASNPDGGSSSLWLGGVIYLAQYYENVGEWQKAAQTWERALKFWQDVEWFQSGVRIDAARAYKHTGTPENYDKAKKRYLQAAHSSDDLHAGGAIIEIFSRELKSNPEQAQDELLQLQKEVVNPDAQLAIQFLLAWARYKAGDWDAFLLQSKQVLTQYESINEQARRRTFAPLVLLLEDARKWAKLWQINTIVAEQPTLDLVFDGPLQQSVERRIFVNTATSTSLQVTVKGDTNDVSVRMEESPWAPELEDIRHQQIVVVTIFPRESQVKAVINVAVARQDDQSLQIPVKVSQSSKGGSNL